MCAFRPQTDLATHAVENQPALRGDLPLWEADAPLKAALEGAAPETGFAPESLAGVIGMADRVAAGHRLATGPGPELHTFDTAGRRIDTVLYPDGYHALMREGMGAGYAALPWTTNASGGHPAHAAMVYLMAQVEPGVCCPMTMTYAAIPALSKGDGLAAILKSLALNRAYDETDEPLEHKHGATVGMAMTEKQGGSDVRANATRAEPANGAYRLTGHKWFCSAPMSDAFLTLAQLPEGLTCFLAPRWRPDGTRNAIHLMRLKNKLGNRANASAEIEYAGAYAEILGEPGDGVRTILEMVHHTRLDTAIAPAGLMRRALSEARYWTENRSAFGKRLIDQPLMQTLLADLALEWLGALAAGMRTAWAFDRSGTDETERAFARLAVALTKYWNNKRCPLVTVEAMEVIGGMGFIEDTPMPLLYREAPLNGIWEGSGNVICLDVLRTLAKAPEAFEALRAELEAARGISTAYDAALDGAYAELKSATESAARRITERLALLLQAAILLKQPDPFPGEIFARTRLGGDWGHTLGTLPAGTDAARLAAMI
ncbi:acyl-CoA dehydrogenase family protein [Pelagibacterium xiamenense]|uniref:acyl-CoA dehydrogenase family protein n=1 Tax=Pelagibacterium xiamenense TaxID=2901140 RepID=UPI001E33B40E|nr:acyl-CoA dehydrogenase family protein [Pelagibacterium xiamenense]MCD7060232.1 acyl-CoA dehydrogenase family protein [Pelagibacterium xiamenense]